ncbi:DUF4123 domain-containing protein [Marinobacter gelidimuriae]|uniref:DUF4123 domain-containing protein n=1 Tax=Marinobacter gelidimuriae TaxID=2739064 RepID=UPI00035FF906|nr:DUF4123 domain-containing protein [Marinobacter gelidimuriae]
MDGVAIPQLGKQIYQWAGDQPISAECLYVATRWEVISDLSPWLVWLSGPEDPVLRGFLEQGPMQEHGYLLVSAADRATANRNNLRNMMQLDQQMKQLQNDHDVAKSTHGHRSEKAQRLVAEFKAAREKHREVGKHVAGALSPVEEIDTGLKLETAATGRAGLTLVLPALDQQELGKFVGHFRQGLTSAPRVNLMGDGLG